MAIRYRWYKITLPLDLVGFIEHLKSHPLNPDSSFGFSYLGKSSSEYQFRFLWRSNIVTTSFDENGDPVYERIATINFMDIAFLSREKNIFLRIENPSRNLRDLMNAIESIVTMGFSCSAVVFSKSSLQPLIENLDTSKLVGFKISGAVVGTDLVARMEFASKSGMQLENINILNKLRYTADSATYEVMYQGVKGQFSFGPSGIVRVSGQLAPKILHLFEESLVH